MNRVAWTRDQLVKTLALYCQIPFGKMHSRNLAVMALAEAIGRTPSAVALKLVNFASLDPELQDRGIGGMANSSAADREVWAEFYGRWDVLAENTIDMESLENEPAKQRTRRAPTAVPTGPTEVLRETKQRRGQAFFRLAVLAAHDRKCCITGISSEPLLRASHIVRWADDELLRLDPRNGLCLNALHDAAFDRGLITLNERFELKVSRRLKGEVPLPVYKEMFETREGVPMMRPERFAPSAAMLKIHRTQVFCA